MEIDGVFRRHSNPLFPAILALFAIALPDRAFCHEDHAQGEERSAAVQALGFIEKPGSSIPLDAEFVTEEGNSVRLSELVTEPAVLTIVYYRCPNACNFLLTNLALLLRNYADDPAKAPLLLTVTVDETETPKDAREAKRIAYAAIERNYPPEKWRFLTGTKENIERLSESVGFMFIKRGADYDHPLGLVILSGEGKVTRYILGVDFLPMDLTMSIMEARAGVIQPTIARIMRLCFSYDPESHSYVFNTLQVSATVILLFAGLFVLYLALSARKKRPKGEPGARTN